MSTAKFRILCSEDDLDTRDMISIILNDSGFEVVCTQNSGDALALAKSQAFDLYLVDNWMPGLTGDQLTRQIREFDSRTPILFYSGAAYPADEENARAAGAQGYLVKPASYNQLVAEVTRLIAEAQVG